MKLIFTLLSIFITITAFSQRGIVRGKVIDDSNGETIIGANVVLEGTSTGTTTDLDGDFSLELDPGTYTLQITYIGYQALSIQDVEVTSGKVTLLRELRLGEEQLDLQEVVVTAKAIRNTETALITLKKKSPAMLDGISSAKFELTGDATAVEAAKRITGVSIEGGKYVYVRGLGDRYSKTMLNYVDIPGLDPDRNSLQMDIFPTILIDNIVVSKNFTADLGADFTGGLVNVETKDFPEEKIFRVSAGIGYNPSMHFNSNYLAYDGGKTDWLGFDDGTRRLPDRAREPNIPTPISGASEQEVVDFVKSFSPALEAQRQTSFLDFDLGISFGDQITLGRKKNRDPERINPKENKLGYILSLSYQTDYRYYDDVTYGEFQRNSNSPDSIALRYATVQQGELGERNVLLGGLAGLAFKTKLSKFRLTAMHLQNGESRAGKFFIDNNGEANGQSGYIATSNNLEYNQRALTNIMLNGTHILGGSGWEIDWRISPTISKSNDPDIRKTAFTITPVDTTFIAGAGGNPSRIWRELSEINAQAKIDVIKNHKAFGDVAKLRFGLSHIYKERDYEILFYDIQFFTSQSWPNPVSADSVLQSKNIFPNRPNSLYYQSGNNFPNPNAYNSNVNNTGAYVSYEFSPLSRLKAILGVRAENFVQRHTGRDQIASNSLRDLIENLGLTEQEAIDSVQNNPSLGKVLDNDKVLDALDFFPSINLIYALTENQNLRASYTRTIARPSFKELSFAQIIDPITNRIFNGGLFTYSDWDGNLSETRIDNIDLRWELFLERGQLISVSGFYKSFDDPIELVRIPEQQTSTEFQPRNVGSGRLFGAEFEFRKDLDFISPFFSRFNVSGNLTVVSSQIDMTDTEFNARKAFERTGETVENTRKMAGQSPYVINAGIGYSDVEQGWDIGLYYNVKGKTLEVVGIGLYPDVLFQPFHSLNFKALKKLGKNQNTVIDFSISNILNDRLESFFESFEAESQIFTRINPGVAFSIGVSHRF